MEVKVEGRGGGEEGRQEGGKRWGGGRFGVKEMIQLHICLCLRHTIVNGKITTTHETESFCGRASGNV